MSHPFVGTVIPEAEEKMGIARAQVLYKAPYFADVVYAMVFVPVDGIATMFVTKRLILGYGTRWALEAPITKLAADIYHEVHHFIRRHFLRGAGFNPELMNICGDLAINPDIVDGGWDLDRLALMPENYKLPRGKTMEEYHDLLRQPAQQGGAPTPKTRGRGNNEQPAEGTPAAAPPGVGTGKCGGISGVAAYPQLEAELDGVADLGRTDVEMKTIEKKAVAAMQAHVESAGRGSLPGNLLELLSAFDTPSWVRWEDELGQLLRDTTGRLQAGGEDFSLARPSKRAMMRGVVRAGMIEHLPEVAIIRDSSASMGASQLIVACREAYAIVQALGIEEVWFVDADTSVATEWKRVGADFFRTLTEVHGRGGTSFIGPIESARKLSPQPDLLVYVTDGDGTAPKNAPLDMTVVWCIVPGYGNRAPARWGHTVMISNDPKKRAAPIQYPSDDDDEDDIIDVVIDSDDDEDD